MLRPPLAAALTLAVGVATLTFAPGLPASAVIPGLLPNLENNVSGGGQYISISCVNATNCTAVGVSNNGDTIHATETNGVWGANIAFATTSSEYDAVSCADAFHCTAVGFESLGTILNPETVPIYAVETNGVWGASTEAPNNNGYQYLAVSCVDATNCTAVGQNTNAKPIYARETNGVWGANTVVPDPNVSQYDGVSCVSAKTCTAVGYESSAGFKPIYATETNGVWGANTVAPDTGGGYTSVSCVSATNCTAVGWNNNNQSIRATETNGVWGHVTVAPDANGGVYDSVSCVSAANCIAVGVDNNDVPIYATEEGGVWSADTEDSATGGGRYESVSCPVANHCTAAGFDNYSAYQPMYTSSGTAVPDAPQTLRATTTAGAATLTWSAVPTSGDGGDPVNDYVATVVGHRSETCTTVTTSCTIFGLKKNTVYSFSVEAHNAVGLSAPSTILVAATTASSFGVLPATPVVLNSALTKVFVNGAPGRVKVNLSAGSVKLSATANARGQVVFLLKTTSAGALSLTASYRTTSAVTSPKATLYVAQLTVPTSAASSSSFAVSISSGVPESTFSVAVSGTSPVTTELDAAGDGAVSIDTATASPLALVISDDGVILKTTEVTVTS